MIVGLLPDIVRILQQWGVNSGKPNAGSARNCAGTPPAMALAM